MTTDTETYDPRMTAYSMVSDAIRLHIDHYDPDLLPLREHRGSLMAIAYEGWRLIGGVGRTPLQDKYDLRHLIGSPADERAALIFAKNDEGCFGLLPEAAPADYRGWLANELTRCAREGCMSYFSVTECTDEGEASYRLLLLPVRNTTGDVTTIYGVFRLLFTDALPHFARTETDDDNIIQFPEG